MTHFRAGSRLSAFCALSRWGPVVWIIDGFSQQYCFSFGRRGGLEGWLGLSYIAEVEPTLGIAARLGNSAAGRIIAPAVMIASTPPPQDLEDFQLAAIGRPSRNSLIQGVSADLPQPFLPGSDDIVQSLDDVVFRLVPGVDLGYLQLINSPWNGARAFLAVTGTSDKAVNWPASVLRGRLWALNGGNLALVREDRIDTIDTRRLTSRGVAMAMTTVVPELKPLATVTSTATRTRSSSVTVTPGPALSSSGQNPAGLAATSGSRGDLGGDNHSCPSHMAEFARQQD